MSRKATEASGRALAIFRATVVFPDPVPPAMPMISGFTERSRKGSIAGDDAQASLQIEASALSRYCNSDGGWEMADGGNDVDWRRDSPNRWVKVSNSQNAVNKGFPPSAVALR